MESTPQTLFDLAAIKARTGYKSSTSVYALMREHGFPQPIRVGRTRRWVATEVNAWIATQIQASRGGAEE